MFIHIHLIEGPLMQSTGEPGRIQVSEQVYRKVMPRLGIGHCGPMAAFGFAACLSRPSIVTPPHATHMSVRHRKSVEMGLAATASGVLLSAPKVVVAGCLRLALLSVVLVGWAVSESGGAPPWDQGPGLPPSLTVAVPHL